EFGELARELDVDFRRHLARKLAFDRLVPGDERVEFWLRNHGCANSGYKVGRPGCRVARGRSAGIMIRRRRVTEIGRELKSAALARRQKLWAARGSAGFRSGCRSAAASELRPCRR